MEANYLSHLNAITLLQAIIISLLDYLFPRTARTKYHKLSDLSHTVLEARSSGSRYWQGFFLLSAVRENACCLDPGGFLAIFGISWSVEAGPYCLPSSSDSFLLVCLPVLYICGLVILDSSPS